MAWEIQLLDASFAKQAVLWHPNSGTNAVSCVVKESIEDEDAITFVTQDLTHKDKLLDEDTDYLLRLVNMDDPTIKRTYLLGGPGKMVHRGEEEAIEVTGTRIWKWLKTRYIYHDTRDFANITLSSLLTELLTASGATTDFQLGTVYNSSEIVDFFSVNNHTILWCLRQLATKMGREMSLDESTSPITINFPQEIGSATNVRIRYGTNLQGIEKRVDKSNLVTRLYAIGGGTPSVRLSASSLASGLDYVQSANYHAVNNNYVDVYHNPDIEDITNLIPAASNPDFSGTYTAGLCAGWTKIGTPTVSENTTATYIEYGTKSQKVIATDGQGIQTSFTGVANADVVRWTNVYVDSLGAGAVVRVELTDGDAVFFNDIETTGSMVAIERRAAKFSGTSQVLKIYAKGGNATFYADAALVSQNDQFKKFVVGDMVDVLYQEAADELARRENAEVSYVVEALDLYEADPQKWSNYQISLGDTNRVEDQKIEIEADQRVKERVWNVIFPEQSGFTVGNVVRSLNNILTDNSQVFRATLERIRVEQDKTDRAGKSLSDDRPVIALVGSFSGDFSSTGHDSFSWTAGVLRIGSFLDYSLDSGSITGLSASTTYYVYFDLDDPGSSLQATDDFDISIGPRKVSVAWLQSGAIADPGLMIVRSDGKPQLSGNILTTGVISAAVCNISAPGSGDAEVLIDSTGIRTYNSGGTQTSEFNVDGSGWLGDPSTGVVWDSDGNLSAGSSFTIGAPIDTDDITGTASGASRVVMDENGIRGYDSGSVQRFEVNTNGTGFLGNSSTGIEWDASGNLTIGSSVTIGGTGATTVESGANRATTGLNSSGRVTKQIDTTNVTEVLGDVANSVMIDGTGIRGIGNTGLVTFRFDATDGSGRLGAAAGSPITWNSSGALSVPGGIITTGISATNITTGTFTVGPDANDKIVISFASGSYEQYRDGSKIIDLGDISPAGISSIYGLTIDHPDAAVGVFKTGEAVSSGDPDIAFTALIDRDTDEASTVAETGYFSQVDLAGRTSGTNGQARGFVATVTNVEGTAVGFLTSEVEGTNQAAGVDISGISALDAGAGDAFGLKVGSVTGGASTGNAYGLYIANSLSGSFKRAIHSLSTADSYLAGKLIADGDFKSNQTTKGFVFSPTGTDPTSAPGDNTTAKRLRLARLGSAPANAAYIKLTQSPGTPTNDFYLVLEDG